LKQLALARPGEPKRGMATRIAEQTPLLFIAPPDVARQPPDVGSVSDRLEPLELVGVDVPGDEVVGAEDDRHTGLGKTSAVRIGVFDVAGEAARVVDEEDVERACLGIADHAREVRPPQSVLAGHEIEVLLARRQEAVPLGEPGLLGALEVGPVAVGLATGGLTDVARPGAPG
jgi:hypothetical protein